jgi:SAM-dependent methyltransferase
MTPLERVSHADELLDQPHHDPAELEISLGHVAQVNRLLGGERALFQTLERYRAADPLNVLDVGTGSGAIPRALVRWARRRSLPIRVRATDIHPQVLEIARKQCASYAEITVEPADALDLPYPDRTFTHTLMTLTFHHFEGQDQRGVLRELARVSRQAAIISELERCWPNYLGARFLAATWWRANRLTRHDGPLSVLRAFTPAELQAAAKAAHLEPAELRRAFFYRLTLVLLPARRAASETE